MPLMDCDAPATPTPTLSNTDLIDRLSLLRPNIIRYSRFTYSGGAYGENPHTDPPVTGAYGNQKKALVLPGGDADVRATIPDQFYGAAEIGHNGGAYSISFYAYLRGGGTSGTFYAGYRDENDDPIAASTFADADADIVDMADDVSFSVTATPTLFVWEHAATNELDQSLPQTNGFFHFFVSGASDIPAGSELVITEFQMQNDDYYAPWTIDLPWRPARGEEDLAQYTEYVLNTNFTELAGRRRQRVTSNLEGVGLLLETNGPVRVIRVPEDTYYVDENADGTLIVTTGTDAGVTQAVVIPNRDQATIRTRSKVIVRQEGDSPFQIIPAANVTINPPIGGSLASVGKGSVMELVKRSSSDVWDVTHSTAASGLTYIAFEAGEPATTITAAKLDSRRMPTPFTVIDARVNVDTAQATGSILTFDFKDGAGASIFSTLPTIDNTEETSVTAATPHVLSTTSLDDDEKVTFHCTQVGDGTAKGARGWLIGYATNAPVIGEGVEVEVTWLQSTFEQVVNDEARMGVGFLDGAGDLILSVQWAEWARPQPFTARSLTAFGPPEAVTARIYMAMRRNTGTNNDGYIDDIEVTIDGAPASLTNPDAETGDATGWTVETGGLDVRSSNPVAAQGTYYFTGGTSASSVAYQDIAL